MRSNHLVSLVCLAICTLLFVASVLLTRTSAPSARLLHALRRSESENKKLHENLNFIAREGGGNWPARKPRQEKDPEYYGALEHGPEAVGSTSCVTIHIAMVAAGYNTSRTVVTLVKSILFYRHNPIHFHFISDSVGRHILSTLFTTWDLPAVKVAFYSTEEAFKSVSWIPNSHYSGVYGLTKLTITSLLPQWLERVIVLDTDLMLLADVALLWHFFREISKRGKLFGVVENQSDWYLGRLWESHRPWPAVGRGFNTGVMLLDLKTMREQNWNRTWHKVASEGIKKHQATALADQDIINAVIKDSPDLHYVLPCSWNAQLSEHSLSEYCFKHARHFKVIHWNSPSKLGVRNNHGPFFKSLYEGFQTYDGEVFKKILLETSCSTEPSDLQSLELRQQSANPCADFQREATKLRITHPFIMDYQHPTPKVNDIALVAGLSMDRVHMLEPLCEHWTGPLSLSIYTTDSELAQIFHLFDTSKVLRNCKRLGLHVVYKSGDLYPVNYLRNVALENARTDFVFLSDADLLPMYGLREYLQEAVRVLGQDKRALVIPAFETHSYKFGFPKDKKKLLDMWDANEVSTFRFHVWPQGHAPTNFEHWKAATSPYRVSWQPNFEPYIVVSRNVTRYDERFAGFGWNKVSHIMDLNRQQYEFVVLPSAFVVHMPHAPSADIEKFRKNQLYRDCVETLKLDFQNELTTKYKCN